MTTRVNKAVNMANELQEKYGVPKEKAVEIALDFLLDRVTKKKDKLLAKLEIERPSWRQRNIKRPIVSES